MHFPALTLLFCAKVLSVHIILHNYIHTFEENQFSISIAAKFQLCMNLPQLPPPWHHTSTAAPTMGASPPGPVSNLRVTSHAATTITIAWTVSGSVDRFGVTYSYTVNRCLETGGPETVTITDEAVRSYTLMNLNEDSRYTITVRAINTAGSTMAIISGDTSEAGKSSYIF